jgi:hypothetical protein
LRNKTFKGKFIKWSLGMIALAFVAFATQAPVNVFAQGEYGYAEDEGAFGYGDEGVFEDEYEENGISENEEYGYYGEDEGLFEDEEGTYGYYGEDNEYNYYDENWFEEDEDWF